MQEIEIWPDKQVGYAQSGIRPGKWDAETSLGFLDTNRSSNLGQTTRPSVSQEKKGIGQILEFGNPANQRVKI